MGHWFIIDLKKDAGPELFLKVICRNDKTTKVMENRKPPRRGKKCGVHGKYK